MPHIREREKESLDSYYVWHNILEGSIYDIDKHMYDELQINPSIDIFKSGVVLLELEIIHTTNIPLYDELNRSLELVVDGELMRWEISAFEIDENFLRSTNTRNFEQNIINYFGLNGFLISKAQLKKLNNAKSIIVKSIGLKKSTNFRFGVENFKILHEFYDKYKANIEKAK